MSRLLLTVGLALAGAATAPAAPPTSDPTGPVAPAPAGGDVTVADGFDPTGTIAAIVALAEYIADEFGLTFDDPVDEFFFFLAVADFYFQLLRYEQAVGDPSAAGQ